MRTGEKPASLKGDDMAVDADRRDDGEDARVPLVYNPVVRSAVFQIALLALVAWGAYSAWTNMLANYAAQGITFGLQFLDDSAGFGIIQHLVDYTETSSFGRTFVVGLLNTILIAVIGIMLATVLGFIAGVARLSSNWMINKLALGYIEIMRNVPLLLWIFIWYFAVLRALPQPRDEPITLIPGLAYLNIKGIYMADYLAQPGFWVVWAALGAAAVASVLVSWWAKKRQDATGQQFPVFWTQLALLLGLPAIAFVASGMPLIVEFPEFKETGPIFRRGFDQNLGINVIPEFLALLLALSTYTAAYIAEIVRAGIQAVSHGQTEAAHALGVRQGPTLRLVVIPQAMRVIIPPMTNQYLNLMKNSSLAVAIAYPDLVSVFAGTTLNQTGRAVEIVFMTMAFYLTFSLIISLIMNWYNARIALVER